MLPSVRQRATKIMRKIITKEAKICMAKKLSIGSREKKKFATRPAPCLGGCAGGK